MTSRPSLHGVLSTRSLYPVSAYYAVAVLASVAIARGWITLSAGIVGLGLIAIGDVLLQMHREVAEVAAMVERDHRELAIHNELVARVEQLIDVLTDLGVDVPTARLVRTPAAPAKDQPDD